MFRRVLFKGWLLTLVCAALLFVRPGGAHMHLCFDGGEPPASLRVTDSGHHADHHDGATHDDRDVWLIGDALTQSGKLDMDLPWLLAAVWLMALLFARPGLVPADAPPASGHRLHFLRPLLRAPPLPAS